MFKKSTLCLILCFIVLISTACKKPEQQEPTSSEAAWTYVSIGLNPIFDFIFDEHGIVQSYRLVNADAEIVGAGENWHALSLDSVLNALIDELEATGYLSADVGPQALWTTVYQTQPTTAPNFESEVRTRLQSQLRERGYEVVVFARQDLDSTLQTQMTTYGLTASEATLMNHHRLSHPEQTMAALAETDLTTLLNTFDTENITLLTAFQTSVESQRLSVKNSLIDTEQHRVTVHRAEVSSESFVLRELSELRAELLENHALLSHDYTAMMSARRLNAEALVDGRVPPHMVGSYLFEYASQEMPYIVNYHTYILHDDGTYTEQFSWSSRTHSQVTTGNNAGTWTVVEGQLKLTNSSGFVTTFDILADRLVRYDEIGFRTGNYINVYFKRH